MTQYKANDGKPQKPGTANGVRAIGWNVDALASGEHVYELKGNIEAGTMITVTLVWDRIIEKSGNEMIKKDDKYENSPKALTELPNFTLEILKGNEWYAISKADGGAEAGANVEHLHYPVPDTAANYKIRVKLEDAVGNTEKYSYGLAWWTSYKPT